MTGLAGHFSVGRSGHEPGGFVPLSLSGSFVFNGSVQRVVVLPEFRQVHRLKDILDRLRPAAEAHVGTEQTGLTSDLYEHADLRRIQELHSTKVDDNVRRSRLPESCQYGDRRVKRTHFGVEIGPTL